MIEITNLWYLIFYGGPRMTPLLSKKMISYKIFLFYEFLYVHKKLTYKKNYFMKANDLEPYKKVLDIFGPPQQIPWLHYFSWRKLTERGDQSSRKHLEFDRVNSVSEGFLGQCWIEHDHSSYRILPFRHSVSLIGLR